MQIQILYGNIASDTVERDSSFSNYLFYGLLLSDGKRMQAGMESGQKYVILDNKRSFAVVFSCSISQ